MHDCAVLVVLLLNTPPFGLYVIEHTFGLHTAYRFTVPEHVDVKFFTDCPFVYATLPVADVAHPVNVYPGRVNPLLVNAFAVPYEKVSLLIVPVASLAFLLNLTV